MFYFLSSSLEYKLPEARDCLLVHCSISNTKNVQDMVNTGANPAFVGPEVYHSWGEESSLEKKRHKAVNIKINMDHINVNILVFILYYSFSGYYHRGNRIKEM